MFSQLHRKSLTFLRVYLEQATSIATTLRKLRRMKSFLWNLRDGGACGKFFEEVA